MTTTVNEERVAGQVPHVVTGHEDRDGRDIGFGISQSAQRFVSSAWRAISGCASATARKVAVLAPERTTLATMPYCAHSRTAVQVKILSAWLAQFIPLCPHEP